MDLYQKWSDPEIAAASAPVPALLILICPSDPSATQQEGDGFLSYVVNAGEATNESAANGICHDLTRPDPVTVDLDYIVNHDGVRQTLLIVESALAGPWTVPDAAAAKLQGAFVWHKAPTDAMKLSAPIEGIFRPNQNLSHARPSSNHAGGFNAGFADGRVKFISNDIDYDVYRQLMTPNSVESDDPVKKKITEADYE
jgi:prepilin-type processing-associated H-X9-DG protein